MRSSARRCRAGFRRAVALPALLLAGCATTVGGRAGDDWSLHGHDLGGQRFPGLAQIDRSNVATPIVVGSVMVVSLPGSSVAALDARDGRELWRYNHRSRVAKTCCGPANRGVAVADGKVYVGTIDGRQYIAVAAGGNALFGFKRGDALRVFALPR